MMVDKMDFIEQQKQFEMFLKSYEDYLRPAYMIAQNNDDETILNVKKIGSHFRLFSLDSICQTRKIFWKYSSINFTPKTTDAIWFKPGDDGSFFIYLIEFKGDKIKNKSTKSRFKEYLEELENDRDQAWNPIDKREINKIINKITPFYNKYSDSMLNSLVLKPLETVTTTIPLIYKDYYLNNKDNDNVKFIDIVDFLKGAVINYYVVLFPDDNPKIDEENEINEYNPFRNRTNAKTLGDTIVEGVYTHSQRDDIELKESYENILNSYYERYKQAEIINRYEFMATDEFNAFVSQSFDE